MGDDDLIDYPRGAISRRGLVTKPNSSMRQRALGSRFMS
jgi:hypothetical protein